MKNTYIIKKNYEFKNLFSKGKFYYGEFVHMYIKETSSSYNKFGIAISKKQGKAVKRNHIKRLIRENYKNFEDRIKTGVQILVIINKEKRIASYTLSSGGVNNFRINPITIQQNSRNDKGDFDKDDNNDPFKNGENSENQPKMFW